jgi:hypothetical protein
MLLLTLATQSNPLYHLSQMAQFRSILGDIRGSIAGTTFSRNGNAAYMRNRATPVNPRSTGQTLSRTALAYVSTLWRSLTQPLQDGWKALAATVPYQDKMGNTSFYSGFQLFVKLNKTLQSNGLATIQAAPAGAPTFPGIAYSGYQSEQDAAVPGDFTLLINLLVAASAAGFNLQVQSTAPISGGINFVNESAYRTIASYPDPITVSPKALTNDWEGVFGIPTGSLIGSAIFTRLRLIDTASGFVSPWSEFKTTVREA